MSEEISVLNRKVRLLQPAGGFRTSLDSVMLAAACPAAAGETVLDLGCGVGGAAFCLLQRVNQIFISGIDIQPEYIDLAEKNAVLNSRQNTCKFLVADIGIFRINEPGQRAGHVICNPPFLDAGTYVPSPDESRATALGHEGQERDLSDWIDCAFCNLQPGGSLTLIHRADHVDKIVQFLGKRFGHVEIFPLWPRQAIAAKRVIIRALKDRRSPAIMHPGVILHTEDGNYTTAADAVLRDGQRLF